MTDPNRTAQARADITRSVNDHESVEYQNMIVTIRLEQSEIDTIVRFEAVVDLKQRRYLP